MPSKPPAASMPWTSARVRCPRSLSSLRPRGADQRYGDIGAAPRTASRPLFVGKSAGSWPALSVPCFWRKPETLRPLDDVGVGPEMSAAQGRGRSAPFSLQTRSGVFRRSQSPHASGMTGRYQAARQFPSSGATSSILWRTDVRPYLSRTGQVSLSANQLVTWRFRPKRSFSTSSSVMVA